MLLLKSWPAGSRPLRCVSSRPYGRAPIPVKLGASRSVTSKDAALKCCGRYRLLSSYPRGVYPPVPFSRLSAISRLGLAILAEIRIVRHRPVIDKAPRHRREHPALAVAVVGGHPGMSPDQLLMLGIDLPDVLIMRVVIDIDRGDALLDHLDQACRDVAALALGLEDHAAAVRGARVRPEHHEEIRKVRHGEAEIGGRIVVGPCGF